MLHSYGADGIERRKVIKNAFKVICESIIPSTHRAFICHAKLWKHFDKETIAEKMKKLKATKKAQLELCEEEKIFYNFLLAVNLDKEQKKQYKVKCDELTKLADEYEMYGIFRFNFITEALKVWFGPDRNS